MKAMEDFYSPFQLTGSRIKNRSNSLTVCQRCRSSASPAILSSSWRAGRDPSLPSVDAHQREEDQHPEPAAAEHAGGPAAALRFVPGKHRHAQRLPVTPRPPSGCTSSGMWTRWTGTVPPVLSWTWPLRLMNLFEAHCRTFIGLFWQKMERNKHFFNVIF